MVFLISCSVVSTLLTADQFLTKELFVYKSAVLYNFAVFKRIIRGISIVWLIQKQVIMWTSLRYAPVSHCPLLVVQSQQIV